MVHTSHPDTRPSIVLIVIDALRADCAPFAEPSPHLRVLNLRRPELPAFTELVSGMSRFRRAFSCAPYTSAAHGSLFTGLLPPEHGVRAFNSTGLSPDVHTLAETLVQAGYAACAMSDEPTILRITGLLRGFQTIAATEDEALAWWDAYTAAPRFLFLHMWDVHKPYGLPKGPRTGQALPAGLAQWIERLRSKNIPIPAPVSESVVGDGWYPVMLMEHAWEDNLGLRAGMENYLAGLLAFDRTRLASLVAALKQRDILSDAIVIVTADHGEGRAEPPSQRLTHSTTLLDDQLHIPLFMRFPVGPPPLAVSQQVSQADIALTVLDALGLPDARPSQRSTYSGRSLWPLLHVRPTAARPLYAEVWSTPPGTGWSEDAQSFEPILRYRALRYPERKYILAGRMPALSDDLLSASDEDFIRRLFGDYLERMPTDDELTHWVNALYSGERTGLPRRLNLRKEFQSSREHRARRKYALYDLKKDPLETRPTVPLQGTAQWTDFEQQAAIMEELDRSARPGSPLNRPKTDAQIIEERLRSLGYTE